MKKKLVWDKTGERLYETGVSQGVLYPIQTGGVYNSGTAWNGLSTVTESPSGAEPTAIYADNIKYLNLMSAEEFGGTIEAYMAPDEFAECDGSKEIAPGVFAGQQNRKMFGLSYKTLLGNDVDSNDYGYKLHLVYGCLASPSEKGYSTVNDSPEAITLGNILSMITAHLSRGAEFHNRENDSKSISTNTTNYTEMTVIFYSVTFQSSMTILSMRLPNENC